MKTIKLSQLSPDTYITYGSKHELACAERLLYDIYNHKRKKKAIAIIGNENYEVEYDVTPEQIEEVIVCCNTNMKVDIHLDKCPHGCDDYPNKDVKDYGSCLEIRYLLKKEK